MSHSLHLLLSLSPTISLFKRHHHQPAPPPPPPPPLPSAPPLLLLSPAPSGLQSYLLTGSESFVTSFQFLTFRLEPRLLPPSANKQENALSEKTVVHRRKSQKRKVGGFDKYILREAPPSPSILSPSPSVSHLFVHSASLPPQWFLVMVIFFFFPFFFCLWCMNIFFGAAWDLLRLLTMLRLTPKSWSNECCCAAGRRHRPDSASLWKTVSAFASGGKRGKEAERWTEREKNDWHGSARSGRSSHYSHRIRMSGT